jgi:hypothetical protein
MEEKENTDMARYGKIARLPRGIRAQLNIRLQDNADGAQILAWLNSLPEVRKILAENFDARPINKQNLSDWRLGGFKEWLIHQDILSHAQQLAANQQELQTVIPGRSFTDHLAGAVAFRYAAILAAAGVELDEKSRAQLRSLGRACQAVVKLRRSDHNAARLKIETERWERVREQMDSDRADALKRRQREDLAAPVWGALKKAERFVQFGGGKAARMAADLLEEIENCPDPAHFDSKVLASLSVPELRRDIQELTNNPPKKKTPVQAAAEMLEEIDAYLAKSESKDQPAQPPSKPRRRCQKPARRRPAQVHRAPHSVHPVPQVHSVHPVQNVHNVRHAATPPSESTPAQSVPSSPASQPCPNLSESGANPAQPSPSGPFPPDALPSTPLKAGQA